MFRIPIAIHLDSMTALMGRLNYNCDAFMHNLQEKQYISIFTFFLTHLSPLTSSLPFMAGLLLGLGSFAILIGQGRTTEFRHVNMEHNPPMRPVKNVH